MSCTNITTCFRIGTDYKDRLITPTDGLGGLSDFRYEIKNQLGGLVKNLTLGAGLEIVGDKIVIQGDALEDLPVGKYDVVFWIDINTNTHDLFSEQLEISADKCDCANVYNLAFTIIPVEIEETVTEIRLNFDDLTPEQQLALTGPKGDKPAHEWNGTSLSFENPDGSMGESVNLKGQKGDKGETGDPFTIYKSYPTIVAMESDFANVPDGSFVAISSNEEDPDNAKLFLRGTDEFTFITDLSGAQGIKGDKGDRGEGYLGIITPSTTIPSSGSWYGTVLEAGVFNNVSPAITVDAADFDVQNGKPNNEVRIIITEGVASKEVRRVRGDKGDAADPAKLPLYSAIKSANIAAGTQFIDDEGDRSIYMAIQTLNVGESPQIYTSKVRKISNADLVYTSKLLNGDFSNGTTSWSSSNATLTNESGTLVATGNGASAQVGTSQSVSVVVGNKYLVKARFKVDSSESLRVDIGNATALSSGFIQTLTPVADTWYEVHIISTAVTSSFTFIISQVFSSVALSTGKKLTIDYVSLVDLTASFPDGIPSDEVLAEIFTNTPAPYKLGVKNLINDKLYKRYVQQNEVVLVTDDNRTAIGNVELFKADSIAIGAVSSPDGTIIPTPSYRTSGFLDVAAFSKVRLSGFTHTNLAYAFYDDNFVPISSTYKTGTSSGFVLNGLIDVPAKAKYFCKTVKTTASFTEDYGTISIKGLVTKDKFDAFAIESDTLTMTKADSTEVIRADLMTDLTKLQGEFTESGVINNTAGYMYSGLLDVTDFNGVFLFGFTYYQLTRFWLDENGVVIQKFDGNISLANYVVSGFYKKPKGAKYFVANIAKPGFVEAVTVKIYGERQLNTSDFQRKGSSGDASQGWETTTTSLKTQKDVEVYSDLYPEVKPLKIINYGKAIGYDYGANINFDTEIFRLGWGLQIGMNVTKANYPDSIYSVKNVQGQNGLIAEWGVEGFSWHVCPPGMDWGERAWMMMKMGGTNVRSNTTLPIRNASMIQTFAPTWTERRDRAGLGSGFNGGWTELTSEGVIDDTIPTRVMLRSSTNFASPEYYRGGYSNMQSATWDRFFRCRGGYASPQAAQHGDSIHKQVYSVATGADAQGNPILKDVAQIEFLYNDDSNPESAKIVFKVWNKVTESWETKLEL